MIEQKTTDLPDQSPQQSDTSKPPNRIPWWVSVLLAIGSYCSLKFVVPGLHPADPAWLKLTQAAPTFAPLTAIFFLLLAAKQLYDGDIGVDGTDKLDSIQEEHEDDRKEGENPGR